MYSSGYSQVSKASPLAQKKMQYRSKGKSCGYYMRIVFFFSSLIQSLIIVSLVLFLVYGKTQDSASTSRIQDLEESFSRLSIENVALRQQRKNLTNLLNTTLTEKARNDWDLAKLIYVSNISAIIIQDIDKQLQQCNTKMFLCQSSGNFAQCPVQPYTGKACNCGLLCERLKARVDLVESNFTQTTQRMRMELDQTTKERDSLNLEVIHLRRDKFTHEKEVEFFRQKCKEDFSQSLSGISNVSKAFLDKIASLFPSHIAFQLTCPKQREHLEQIRTNCTSLSLEVEDRLQHYLDKVGNQVANIEGENSRLKAENLRLSEDYRSCSMNRTGMMLQHRQNVDKLQQKHDEEKEKLLVDKLRLIGEKEVLVNEVKYKSKAIDHLTEQTKQLNMSCMLKAGGFPGGSSSLQPQPSWNIFGGGSSSSGSQLGRAGSGGLGSSFISLGSPFNKPGSTGTGSSTSSLSSSGLGSSTGLGYNKPGSTGTGSSSSSSGLGSSTGLGYNKPGSTGTGSSSSSSGLGSSTGLGYNKPGSTGVGSSSSSSGSGSSTGLGYNKPGSTGVGSSSSSSSSVGSGQNKPASTGGISSSFGSSSGTGINKPVLNGRGSSTLGSSSATSGIGSNKPTSSVKSTSGIGSSSGSTGSTGSTSKSGSSSFSWLGFGSSSSGQSKTGTGTGKGPSTGNSGGTGSLFGGGRTSGLGGGSTINVAQHLKDLQRIINPPGPEEKQDLARILG